MVPSGILAQLTIKKLIPKTANILFIIILSLSFIQLSLIVNLDLLMSMLIEPLPGLFQDQLAMLIGDAKLAKDGNKVID
ncbi:hypothetical protein AYI74_11735 [Shewanella algae]|nr:hypothetical protein BEH76_20235 [Shewanella algae]OHY53092.1 hypothetical protein BEH76_08075 [Shewanella algae]TVL50285.1 hypothetical protein AYI98_08460 [Shewanella algae]TVO84749.1 hypothetical protein AYI76_09595 [Shewanella algae]TVO86693.1 hypothetical protein AYI78_07105 [Shewanella algae]